jgi:hypothetical protein
MTWEGCGSKHSWPTLRQGLLIRHLDTGSENRRWKLSAVSRSGLAPLAFQSGALAVRTGAGKLSAVSRSGLSPLAFESGVVAVRTSAGKLSAVSRSGLSPLAFESGALAVRTSAGNSVQRVGLACRHSHSSLEQ